MPQYAHIVRCPDLSRADIVAALASPDSTYDLCARLSYVSRQGETAEPLLRVFSLLASGSTDWLEGELRVTFDASGMHTIVTAFERTSEGRFVELFPPLRFAMSVTELRLTVESHPQVISGLEVWEAPRGVELGIAEGSKSVVPRSRAASSGVRPAMSVPPPSSERGAIGPARRQTRKVPIPTEEALRKMKDG